MEIMKKVAQSVSYVFHPLLVPLYGIFFIFNSGSIFSFIPGMARLYCYLITFLSVLLLPLFCLFLFKKFGIIHNYALDSKQERVYPALAAIFCSFLGFYFIGKVPYTNIVQQMYLVLIIVLSAFSLVTLRWKMSMHMTAAGAACGFLLILGFKYWGDVRNIFMVVLLLSGILATCRLYLKKHNPIQVYVGFIFGLIFVVTILY